MESEVNGFSFPSSRISRNSAASYITDDEVIYDVPNGIGSENSSDDHNGNTQLNYDLNWKQCPRAINENNNGTTPYSSNVGHCNDSFVIDDEKITSIVPSRNSDNTYENISEFGPGSVAPSHYDNNTIYENISLYNESASYSPRIDDAHSTYGNKFQVLNGNSYYVRNGTYASRVDGTNNSVSNSEIHSREYETNDCGSGTYISRGEDTYYSVSNKRESDVSGSNSTISGHFSRNSGGFKNDIINSSTRSSNDLSRNGHSLEVGHTTLFFVSAIRKCSSFSTLPTSLKRKIPKIPEERDQVQAIFWLIKVEAEYWQSLAKLEEVYISELQLLFEKNYDIDVSKYFQDIKDVTETSKEFLMEVEQFLKNDLNIIELCNIFWKFFNNKEMYTEYIRSIFRISRLQETGNKNMSKDLKILNEKSDIPRDGLYRHIRYSNDRLMKVQQSIENILATINSSEFANLLFSNAFSTIKDTIFQFTQVYKEECALLELQMLEEKLVFEDTRYTIAQYNRLLIDQADIYLAVSLDKWPLTKIYRLILLTDMLLIASKKSFRDKFVVIHCTPIEDLGWKEVSNSVQSNKCVVISLRNDGSTEYIISFANRATHERWLRYFNFQLIGSDFGEESC